MKKLNLFLIFCLSGPVCAEVYKYTVADLVKSVRDEAAVVLKDGKDLSKFEIGTSSVKIKSSTVVDGTTTLDKTVTVESIADLSLKNCKGDLSSTIERLAKIYGLELYRKNKQKDPNIVLVENKVELIDIAFAQRKDMKKIAKDAVTMFVKVSTDCSIDVVDGIGQGLTSAIVATVKVE